MRACFQFPECSISYTKILQGESNGKEGKRSFTALDTAEPKHILYKDIANERKESLLSISRVQHILYKDIANERKESLLSISRVQHILYKDMKLIHHGIFF